MDIFGVKNTGTREYNETLNTGEKICIPAGATIDLPRGTAIHLMSTRPPAGVKVDGMGQLRPECEKSLQLDRRPPVERKVFVSERNGERYNTERDMVEQDSKYNPTQKVLANSHACHFCDFTSDTAESVLEHVGKEHISDTIRHTKPSPVAV